MLTKFGTKCLFVFLFEVPSSLTRNFLSWITIVEFSALYSMKAVLVVTFTYKININVVHKLVRIHKGWVEHNSFHLPQTDECCFFIPEGFKLGKSLESVEPLALLFILHLVVFGIGFSGSHWYSLYFPLCMMASLNRSCCSLILLFFWLQEIYYVDFL